MFMNTNFQEKVFWKGNIFIGKTTEVSTFYKLFLGDLVLKGRRVGVSKMGFTSV